jgi:hypothetical protein
VADFEKSGMAAKRIDGVKIDTLKGRMPGRTPNAGSWGEEEDLEGV